MASLPWSTVDLLTIVSMHMTWFYNAPASRQLLMKGSWIIFGLLTLFFIAFASQIGRTESACALPASIVSCNISRLVNPRSGRYRTQDGWYSPVENYTGLGL